MKTGRPSPAEYAAPFHAYVTRVPETDVLEVLERQKGEMRAVLAGIPGDRERFRYEPGKWTIREVVGHMLDGERVFGYRAMCIARGDTQPLPGFDETTYAANGDYDATPLASLAEEFATLRVSNALMLRRLSDAAWTLTGIANGHPVSVRAVAFVMAGHVRHHLSVLETRYGAAAPG